MVASTEHPLQTQRPGIYIWTDFGAGATIIQMSWLTRLNMIKLDQRIIKQVPFTYAISGMRGMSWGSHLKPIHHRGCFQVHSAVFEEKWIALSHSIPCKKKQLRGTFFSSDDGAFLSPPSPIQMSAGCSKPAVQTETHGWHEWDESYSRGVCFSLIKTEVDEMRSDEQLRAAS